MAVAAGDAPIPVMDAQLGALIPADFASAIDCLRFRVEMGARTLINFCGSISAEPHPSQA